MKIPVKNYPERGWENHRADIRFSKYIPFCSVWEDLITGDKTYFYRPVVIKNQKPLKTYPLVKNHFEFEQVKKFLISNQVFYAGKYMVFDNELNVLLSIATDTKSFSKTVIFVSSKMFLPVWKKLFDKLNEWFLQDLIAKGAEMKVMSSWEIENLLFTSPVKPFNNFETLDDYKNYLKTIVKEVLWG